MTNRKYSAQELSEAVGAACKTLGIINEIFGDVTPVVEGAVKGVIGKEFRMDDGTDSRFVIRDAEPIVSYFGSFVTLYFVNDEAIRSIRRADLSREELDEGMWDLIRAYRKGDVSAYDFCNSLDLERTESLCFTLRLRLGTEELVAIYDSESFDISVSDGRFTVRAGHHELGTIPFGAHDLDCASTGEAPDEYST